LADFLQQTFIGDVVIAINPYKALKIYEDKHVEQYRGKNIYEIPPHM
jgi:myosin-1